MEVGDNIEEEKKTENGHGGWSSNGGREKTELLKVDKTQGIFLATTCKSKSCMEKGNT